MLTPEEIQKLAELARIEIGTEEREKLSGEIESILHYVGEISSLSGEPAQRALSEVRNVLREDEKAHESGVYTEAILKNAPNKEGSHFRVKKIL